MLTKLSPEYFWGIPDNAVNSSRSYSIFRETLRTTMDTDIDGVLSIGNLQPKWSDIRDILSFPDICAQEECTHLENNPLHSAVFPEFEQPSDEINVFLSQLGARTELLQQEDDFQEDFHVPAYECSQEYLQWMETAGLSTMQTMHDRSLRNAGNLIQASGTLLKLADELEYLPPHNDSHLGHHTINIDSWRIYWHALIAEMKTVEELCLLSNINSGVFVLTTWPYKEFLRLLAERLLATGISIMYDNEN